MPSLKRYLLCRRSLRRMSFLSLTSVLLASIYISFTRIRALHPNMGIHHDGIRFSADNITQEQACVHPSLDLWHPALSSYFKDPEPLKCHEVENNWVYVENGTFKISSAAEKQYGDILCEYMPILRGEDDFEIIEGAKVRPMLSGMKIDSDFFEAKCVSKSGKVYHNLHLGIAKKKEIHERVLSVPDNSMRLNILMFGFDSVSRMTWMRNLPKSYDYFVNDLKGGVLEGYNIVGDGTPQALTPILTGKNETELPESRRGHTDRTVDDLPWIWTTLRDAGYVTQWGEDGQRFGTYTYRMNGFKSQPVDHYMRPYYLRSESKWYSKNFAYCQGSVPRHQNMLNWIEDMHKMYPEKLKFSFLFHSELTHDGYSKVRVVDQDLSRLLKSLNEKGYLENTALVLMSDHGARFVDMRRTLQGKYEERMPFFAFRFPPWFNTKYPKAHENLQKNLQRLTTPFDIHATFHDILSHDPDYKAPDPIPRGISLFKEIPGSRSCKDAHIAPHWCACLQWKNVPVSDKGVQQAVKSLLNTMNAMTNDNRKLCSKLTISEINSAVRYTDNDKVLRFKQSADSDGREPDLSDQMGAYGVLYQIFITTTPGNGQFEATVKQNLPSGTFSTSTREISRINRYGDAPHCVQDRFPHLRAYCYCNEQKS